ncbi:MAG: potassium transporter Kup [Verrucomicrobiota bacterium]
MTTDNLQDPKNSKHRAGLILGAMGIVYGDIGTSPLYALRECFHGEHGIPVAPANIFGVLSLIFWTLIIIVSIKYLLFVMRADKGGEGGILSLFSTSFPGRHDAKTSVANKIFIGLAIFGAALLYGDGMITPAISVLSAVEGLSEVTLFFKPYIIPITLVVIVVLFSFQRIGTANVAKIFGPITLFWFVTIGVLGLREIAYEPRIFAALNPRWAFYFFQQNGFAAFVVLGSVFLVVTGAEALYADMGHFGKRPIRRAWAYVVLPALLLNYFGQGALLLLHPEAAESPFYRLAPAWALLPLVILATFSTVIASQAMISGTFSLTMQAIQLGYSPRMEIAHTSQTTRGQIYIKRVNWLLMAACIALVLGFGSSSNLAAAYGVAVSLTMLITTVLFYTVARKIWRWNIWAAAIPCGIFLIIELAFFGSNLLKVQHGGWFPLFVGLLIFIVMTTWKTGRDILGQKLRAGSLPLHLFLEDVEARPPLRVSGTAVFLYGNSEGTPLALLHNLKHNKVLHERVVILTICTEQIPYVEEANRVSVEKMGNEFFRVRGFYGFIEEPNVPELLRTCEKDLPLKEATTTYFLSHETLIATSRPGMAIWREKLFALLTRNAQPASTFFHLPANRVVELGMQVEL